MHYFVYLDEFGHIGPYISRTHPKYNTSPLFGLAGLILPASSIRKFSAFFFQLKNRLCSYELSKSGVPAYKWEYKGASVFRPKNIIQYPELRSSTFRLLNGIHNFGGHIFYVGIEKNISPEQWSAEKLYLSVLREVIKRIDEFATEHTATVSIILDQISDFNSRNTFRELVVGKACSEMYGLNHRSCLVEPPMQVESYLYQTIQCADWLCALISKIETFNLQPDEFSDYEPLRQYFSSRIRLNSVRSGIRKAKR